MRAAPTKESAAVRVIPRPYTINELMDAGWTMSKQYRTDTLPHVTGVWLGFFGGTDIEVRLYDSPEDAEQWGMASAEGAVGFPEAVVSDNVVLLCESTSACWSLLEALGASAIPTPTRVPIAPPPTSTPTPVPLTPSGPGIGSYEPNEPGTSDWSGGGTYNSQITAGTGLVKGRVTLEDTPPGTQVLVYRPTYTSCSLDKPQLRDDVLLAFGLEGETSSFCVRGSGAAGWTVADSGEVWTLESKEGEWGDIFVIVVSDDSRIKFENVTVDAYEDVTLLDIEVPAGVFFYLYGGTEEILPTRTPEPTPTVPPTPAPLPTTTPTPAPTALPTSVPTATAQPTPTVLQLMWLDSTRVQVSEVQRGSLITLRAVATGLDGQTLAVQIYETDPGSPDDLVTSVDLTFFRGVGEGTWEAVWMADGFMGFGGDPEYKFVLLGVDSPDLTVR